MGIVSSEENQDENKIEIDGSHIYFYAGVNSKTSLQFIKALREVESTLDRAKRLGENETPIIHVHINSGGGSLLDAFACLDVIKSLSIPVHAYGEGMVCSAATIIFCACDKRYIGANTFSLFHQLSSTHWGTHEEFISELELQKELMKSLVNFYKNHSKMSKSDIREMLKSDTWLNSRQMIKHGFADVVGVGA